MADPIILMIMLYPRYQQRTGGFGLFHKQNGYYIRGEVVWGGHGFAPKLFR